jgi:hypothetical protein
MVAVYNLAGVWHPDAPTYHRPSAKQRRGPCTIRINNKILPSFRDSATATDTIQSSIDYVQALPNGNGARFRRLESK